jgi:hypothetical protein
VDRNCRKAAWTGALTAKPEMAPPAMCCSVAAPVWQKQHIVPSAIKRGELLVPDYCSVRSQLFLERHPQKQFLKDGAYCHRLTGRRKVKTPSCVSAKGSVSVVEERDASSVHRGVGTGQEAGFGLSEKEKGMTFDITRICSTYELALECMQVESEGLSLSGVSPRASYLFMNVRSFELVYVSTEQILPNQFHAQVWSMYTYKLMSSLAG